MLWCISVAPFFPCASIYCEGLLRFLGVSGLDSLEFQSHDYLHWTLLNWLTIIKFSCLGMGSRELSVPVTFNSRIYSLSPVSGLTSLNASQKHWFFFSLFSFLFIRMEQRFPASLMPPSKPEACPWAICHGGLCSFLSLNKCPGLQTLPLSAFSSSVPAAWIWGVSLCLAKAPGVICVSHLPSLPSSHILPSHGACRVPSCAPSRSTHPERHDFCVSWWAASYGLLPIKNPIPVCFKALRGGR